MLYTTIIAEVCLKLEGFRSQESIVGEDSQLTVANTVQYILLTQFVKEEKLVALLQKVMKEDITTTTITIQLMSQFSVGTNLVTIQDLEPLYLMRDQKTFYLANLEERQGKD